MKDAELIDASPCCGYKLSNGSLCQQKALTPIPITKDTWKYLCHVHYEMIRVRTDVDEEIEKRRCEFATPDQCFEYLENLLNKNKPVSRKERGRVS